MIRQKKIYLGAFAVLLILILTLVVLVKTLVTPEKIRETLVPLAEQGLQRKVTLENIEIGLFSGVSLKELQVQGKGGSEQIFSVKSVNLSFQWLPLLTGKIVIDQVKLVAPKLVVIRNPDGSFNFSDLLGSESEVSREEAARENSSGKSFSTGPIDLLVSEVVMSSGELLFIDRLTNPEAPLRFALGQMSLQARKITLGRPFPLDLSANLNGANISLSGTLDLKTRQGSLNLSLTPLGLVQFAPYYRAALPGRLSDGRLALNLEADFSAARISSKGNVTLEQVDLHLNALPRANLRQARLAVDFSLSYATEPRQLDISTMFINFNDVVCRTEGQIGFAGKEPDLNLQLLLDHFDLRTLVRGLPAGLIAEIRNFDPAGMVTGRVTLIGPPSAGGKLIQEAHLLLEDVQGSLGHVRAGVSGALDLTKQGLKTTDLQLSLGGQSARLEVNTTGLKDTPIRGRFQISAERLDLNPLLPHSAETGGEGDGSAGNNLPPTTAAAPAVGQEIGPFDLPLAMRGNLTVDQMIYKQLTLDRVQAELQLEDNRLQVISLRGGVAGGELTGSAACDLGVKGLAYQGQVKLAQASLEPLFRGLFPEAGQRLSGRLQWQNDFSGRGTLAPTLLNSLLMKGALDIRQGTASGSPLQEQLAGFLGRPDLRALRINSLQTRYDLQNGMARLSGLLDSPQMKLTSAGTVGLNGRLNLTLDTRLAPDLLNDLGGKGVVQQAITDENGWGLLPLNLGGTVDSPRFGLNGELLQKQAFEKGKQELEKQLLKKSLPDQKDQVPVQQLLDKTLNRLFGQ